MKKLLVLASLALIGVACCKSDDDNNNNSNNSSKDSNMLCIYETSAVQRNISVLSTLFFS